MTLTKMNAAHRHMHTAHAHCRLSHDGVGSCAPVQSSQLQVQQQNSVPIDASLSFNRVLQAESLRERERETE